MQYIVLDLEFNQPFPFKTGTVTKLDPECPFEIIQIGAVKLNDNFEVIGHFDFLIKPQIYERVHPYVEKITGITIKQLIDRPNFATAYEDFCSFIGNDESVLCTWGIDDIKSLYKNILYYDLDAEKITPRYINVQSHASKYLNYEAGKCIGLKNAITELKLEIDQPFHNALFDAIYTAKVFGAVCTQNVSPDDFQILDIAKKKLPKARIDTRALFSHMETVLKRELSDEEKSIIKTAYKLGKKCAFDVKPEKHVLSH